MCHCESVASSLLDTTVESFDRHFAVNARATWLLIREHGRRFRGSPGTGRIISLTSDHTAGNLRPGHRPDRAGGPGVRAARRRDVPADQPSPRQEDPADQPSPRQEDPADRA